MTPKLKLVRPDDNEQQQFSRGFTESPDFKTRLKKEGEEVVLFTVQLGKHVFITAMLLGVVAVGLWLEHWYERHIPGRDPRPDAQPKTNKRPESIQKPQKAHKIKAK